MYYFQKRYPASIIVPKKLLAHDHSQNKISPGSPVFFPPQKPTLQILIQSGNDGHTFVSFELLVSPSLNKVNLFILIYFYPFPYPQV